MSADIHRLVGAYAVDAHRRAGAQRLRAAPRRVPRVPRRGRQPASSRRTLLASMSETAPPPSMRDCGARRHPAPSARSPLSAAGRWAPRHPPLDPSPAARSPPADDAGPRDPMTTEPDLPPTSSASVASPADGPGSRRRLPRPRCSSGGIAWSPWDNGPTGNQSTAEPGARRPRTPSGSRRTSVAPRRPSCAAPRSARPSIIADNMPAAPDGKDFQLWFDRAQPGAWSAPASCRTVSADDRDRAARAAMPPRPLGGRHHPRADRVARRRRRPRHRAVRRSPDRKRTEAAQPAEPTRRSGSRRRDLLETASVARVRPLRHAASASRRR